MYIHNVESENHYVVIIIKNVAQNKKEKIQNIASDIMNGDIMNGDVVDAPHFDRDLIVNFQSSTLGKIFFLLLY